MNQKRQFKRIFVFSLITVLLVGAIFAIRSYGIYKQKQLEAKREAEILKFWTDYSAAKDGNNEIAKKIKDDFVNRMSEDMSVEELLDLINKTLENPITLDELINK